MNIIVVTIISILSLFNLSDNNDMDKVVLDALMNSDAKRLSNLFTSSIKISILKDEQIANKYQAELIVSDFFKNNKLVEIKRLSQPKNISINCLVYEVKTLKGRQRIFMKIVNLKNKDHISEFLVE
jgi:ribosomal protein S17E